jgi:hypothetical protein
LLKDSFFGGGRCLVEVARHRFIDMLRFHVEVSCRSTCWSSVVVAKPATTTPPPLPSPPHRPSYTPQSRPGWVLWRAFDASSPSTSDCSGPTKRKNGTWQMGTGGKGYDGNTTLL